MCSSQHMQLIGESLPIDCPDVPLLPETMGKAQATNQPLVFTGLAVLMPSVIFEHHSLV